MRMTAMGRFLFANLVLAAGLAGCGSDPVALESVGTQGQPVIDPTQSSDHQLAQLNTTSKDAKVAAPLRDVPAEALSAEMRAAIEANGDFQKLRAQLKRGGDIISIDQGALYRDEHGFGVVFPIEHITSGAGEYASIIYQKMNGARATVSLDLVEPAASEDLDEGLGRRTGPRIPQDVRATEPKASATCGPWGEWYTIGKPYCEPRITCPFRLATMWYRERTRICWISGASYIESEHTSVRHDCDC